MEQSQVLEGHTDNVNFLAVSRDGKWLASGSKDGTVRLWDTNTCKEVAVLKHGTIAYGGAFTPDSTRLAYVRADSSHIPPYPIVHQGKDVLSVEEHRELFTDAGYSDVQVITEPSKGWICCIGSKARVS